LQFIEKIGRTCYLSEDRITEDGESALKFNEMILRREHEAMIEHSLLSVRFTVDRGVSHEMVRHRVASFAQESTRYVNYAKEKFGNEISVIDPINGMTLDTKMKNMDLDIIGEIYEEWMTAMEDAEKHYMRMIELGATPQMARSVLPHSTKTSIVITTNYREWRHFFELRTPKDAHPQIREVAIPLLRELQQKIPVIFDDIEVEE
jgi:thymidylate synthase (FAD)